MRLFVFSLVFLLVQALPELPDPVTPFEVENCDDVSSLRATQTAVLASHGFTKCVLAFGVLTTGTADYPDNYLLTAANVIAGILDQDNDGKVDDPVLGSLLSVHQSDAPPLMQGAPTQTQESRGDYLGDQVNFAYAFSLQTWHASGYSLDQFDPRPIIVEEVFHMVTQFGYSVAFPQSFGFDDFTSSVAARECAAASCVWWSHPENSCPQGLGVHVPPPLDGTCNDPGCDCVEWFHQVALVLAGQEPGWRGFDLTKESLRAVLSQEFLDIMDDPASQQLTRPISYNYQPDGSTSPCPAGCVRDPTASSSRRLLFGSVRTSTSCPSWCIAAA
jgi:hypothetical protein